MNENTISRQVLPAQFKGNNEEKKQRASGQILYPFQQKRRQFA